MQSKTEANIVGCRSESEMLDKLVLKVSELEGIATELQTPSQQLRAENTRDQMPALLEQNTKKSSTDSLRSDLGEAAEQKSSSSGMGSDLSDPETSDSQPSSMRSRSSSQEKRFLDSDCLWDERS